MPRLFTGIEIPKHATDALSLICGGLPVARWISSEDYHITLRYIGDVDMQTAHEVGDALGRIGPIPGFAVRLTHTDFFGGKRPRAFYAGIAANPTLTHLHAVQERAFQNIGLAPNRRKFSPHVTLARLGNASAKDVARFMSEAPWFQPLLFDVGRYVLYSSRASVGGGPYIIEETYDLQDISQNT